MRQSYSMVAVPYPDFERESYASFDYQTPINQYLYDGPQYTLSRAVLGTSFSGNVLQAPRPAINSSYTLKFFGPSLVCEDAPPVLKSKYDDIAPKDNFYLRSLLYAAWAENSTTEFDILKSYAGGPDVDFNNNGILLRNTGPATFYFAVQSPWTWPSKLLRCMLYNTSFVVDYRNDGTEQVQTIREAQPLNAVATKTKYIPTFNATSYKSEPMPAQIRQLVAYTAVLDTFYRLLFGGVVHSEDTDNNLWSTYSTQVMATSLGQTSDLYSILLENDQMGDLDSTDPADVGKTDTSFRTAVQELFHNVTLSLLAFDRFRSNTSADSSPPLTNVTTHSPYIVYSYSPRNLVIAYTSAVVVAALIVMAGTAVLVATRACYSDSFSTVLGDNKGRHSCSARLKRGRTRRSRPFTEAAW